MSEVLDWIMLLAVCVGSGLAAVMFLKPATRTKGWGNALLSTGEAEDPIWLFDGQTLLDATDTGRELLGHGSEGQDWVRLKQALTDRFPTFPNSPGSLVPGAPLTIPTTREDDATQLHASLQDGIIRVHVQPKTHCSWTDARMQETEHELDMLRSYLHHAPHPMWKVEDDNRVSWANEAYQRLFETVQGAPFDLDRPLFSAVPQGPNQTSRKRQCLAIADTGRTLWFDVTCTQHETSCIYSATDIDAVVSAEIAQRNFVQTLAKTFAQLSAGLAIFDRNGQLALFNPALIDLTSLPADFLSARPTILSFFDRLRENRMVPEPKNYNSWRQQMADLVEAASDGRYQETWSLPSGSVYQVSGRPHPDGAIAFLLEDITAEVTLTRRFRSDIELNQSVLNQVDDAIVVFSATGVLGLCNAAYRALWSVDPDASFADTTVLDATRHWQSSCKATPISGEVRDFIGSTENRTKWSGMITLKDDRWVHCTVSPVQNGGTMIRFQVQWTDQPAPLAPKRQDSFV